VSGQGVLVGPQVGLGDTDQPVALLDDQEPVELVLGQPLPRRLLVLVGPMVTRSLVATSRTVVELGSRPVATTRAMMSRSVIMATTRLPSTTGSGPFSCSIIRVAASTTVAVGSIVTMEAMRS
jgi:hypothetical protein